MCKYILVLFVVSFVSCRVEKTGSAATLIVNESSHDIEILPFINGEIDSSYHKSIKGKSVQSVYQSNGKGKTTGPPFGLYLQPFDSIVVLFDKKSKSVHLKFNSIADTLRKVVFLSKRNITNESNYEFKILKETKTYIEGEYTYTFTEQDYLDAQK